MTHMKNVSMWYTKKASWIYCKTQKKENVNIALKNITTKLHNMFVNRHIDFILLFLFDPANISSIDLNILQQKSIECVINLSSKHKKTKII